jgi:hypothetical protein
VTAFLFWAAVSFVIAIIFASFFEWSLHRFVMHKRVSFFSYPFEKHAMVHHQIFKADETYHLIHEKDKYTIPMAWWNGPAMIAVGTIPFAVVAVMLRSWGFVCGSFVAFSGYYGTYEYLHWCMHLPRKRNVERTGFFFRLNGHHLLHHRYMGKNFNVVMPLADLCLGTLLLRSKIHFKQATGPCVPDVQPKAPKRDLVATA